jgi:Right handed beta helix region
MRVMKILAAAALAAFVSAVFAGPSAADVIKVSPGDSIQAAIDSAGSYDTIKLAPGTYHENVQIKKDGITLKGAGADETIIEPGTGSGSVDPFCGGPSVGGICVADVTVPANPNDPPVVNNQVADVQIKNLTVRNFQGGGVFFFGTRDQRVSGVHSQNNKEYGIVAFNTTGGQYWDNFTDGNGEAGIYVGDSPQANALVRNNVSTGNIGDGIFIRDASHGTVTGNEVTGNCIGILFLNTGSGIEDWTASHNTANHNNAACPASDGPPTSGIGIAIAGAKEIDLVGNTTNDNQPSGDTIASAGIVVLTLPGPTGDLLADENTVKFNRAFGNSPVDILWDQKGSSNSFLGNQCDASNPDGLCSERHGGGGNGGNGNDNGDHHGKGHGKHHKHHKHHKHKG